MTTYSPPWQQLPDERPGDGREYWVTQYKWITRPTLALWDDSLLEWRLLSLSVSYPWYIFPWFREVSVEVDLDETPPEPPDDG